MISSFIMYHGSLNSMVFRSPESDPGHDHSVRCDKKPWMGTQWPQYPLSPFILWLILLFEFILETSLSLSHLWVHEILRTSKHGSIVYLLLFASVDWNLGTIWVLFVGGNLHTKGRKTWPVMKQMSSWLFGMLQHWWDSRKALNPMASTENSPIFHS